MGDASDIALRREKPWGRALNAFLWACAALLWLCQPASYGWNESDAPALIEKMESAYAEVKDYQTRLVIEGFGQGTDFRKTQRLVYIFKKPNKIRIDFENPHRGMVITYPDKNGDVVIRPKPWAQFLTLHLDPTHSFLEISPGQYIHQTDLGMLIKNITHSVTDMYMGDLQVTADDKHVVIRVLSDNPFRRGLPTRYEFSIDVRLWLPVAVRESSAEGDLRRTVDYLDLKLNAGVPDSLFRLD
jgi:outer membrane lipoprotein-sorting protein